MKDRMQAAELSKHDFDFQQYLAARRVTVEEALEGYLRMQEPKILWESIRYSVLSGGKRLRALLCLAAAEACQTSGKEPALQAVLPCACAIEMIHAMSLIHDDLPAMDNDDLRRGKPTNHKVFGEAVALLAGDALLVMAPETILEHTPLFVPREKVIQVVRELFRATGASGMVGGQVDDFLYTGSVDSPGGSLPPLEATATRSAAPEGGYAASRSALRSGAEQSVDTRGGGEGRSRRSDYIDESLLVSIHKRKTGALIRFALWSGACLAGADDMQLMSISEYGEILGLAFQIADDLLDTTGDATTLGKTPGKDQASKKATWVTVFGVDESQKRLKGLETRGLELLSASHLNPAGRAALSALLSFAVHRKN